MSLSGLQRTKQKERVLDHFITVKRPSEFIVFTFLSQIFLNCKRIAVKFLARFRKLRQNCLQRINTNFKELSG